MSPIASIPKHRISGTGYVGVFDPPDDPPPMHLLSYKRFAGWRSSQYDHVLLSVSFRGREADEFVGANEMVGAVVGIHCGSSSSSVCAGDASGIVS